MRVLIADDHRDTVMTLGILLRSEGHEVWSTQSGSEVASAVREFKPRLVLLDIAMPDRSGYEVAQELYREYGPECPVLVALSGQCDAAARTRAEVSGFHHFIAKPYEATRLLAFIGELEKQLTAEAAAR